MLSCIFNNFSHKGYHTKLENRLIAFKLKYVLKKIKILFVSLIYSLLRHTNTSASEC